MNLTVHDRLFTPGATNRGNALGPLSMDPVDDHNATWLLKVKQKFELFGRHGPRIPVGGTPDDMDIDEELGQAPAKNKPRDKLSEEPLFFHALPASVSHELMHSYDAVAFISLSAGEGKAALEAIKRRIPYFGVTCTETHSRWLLSRLEALVFKSFQNPEDTLFQPGLVGILGCEDDKAVGAPATSAAGGGKRRAAAAAAGGPPAPAAKASKRASGASSASGAAASTPAPGASSAKAIIAKVKALAAAAVEDDDGAEGAAAADGGGV